MLPPLPRARKPVVPSAAALAAHPPPPAASGDPAVPAGTPGAKTAEEPPTGQEGTMYGGSSGSRSPRSPALRLEHRDRVARSLAEELAILGLSTYAHRLAKEELDADALKVCAPALVPTRAPAPALAVAPAPAPGPAVCFSERPEQWASPQVATEADQTLTLTLSNGAPHRWQLRLTSSPSASPPARASSSWRTLASPAPLPPPPRRRWRLGPAPAPT